MNQAEIDLLESKNAVGSLTWEKKSGTVRAFLHPDYTWSFEGPSPWDQMFEAAVGNALIDFPPDSPGIGLYYVYIIEELSKKLKGRAAVIPGSRNPPPPGCIY